MTLNWLLDSYQTSIERMNESDFSRDHLAVTLEGKKCTRLGLVTREDPTKHKIYARFLCKSFTSDDEFDLRFCIGVGKSPFQ